MIGILGKKLGMTQFFDGDGKQVPVTLVHAGPCYVTALRNQDKNGYSAVQLGFDALKLKHTNRAELGAAKKLALPALRFMREIRTSDVAGLEVAAQVDVASFEQGDYVDVTGVSIGKGFQGVVKRHHFKGGTGGRGTKMGREPGSIGSKAGGNGCRKKVMKGKRLPGHMGRDVVTVQNLAVVKVVADQDILVLRGAVPGAEGGYLVVRMALKRAAQGRKWKIKNQGQAPLEAPASVASQSDSGTKADPS